MARPAAGKAQAGLGIPSTGFPWMSCDVLSVDEDMALVRDQMGAQRNISIAYRRGAGPRPRVGEKWAIDRTLGFWTFATVLNASPPVITGSNGNIPALQNLLAALAESGLIIDQTEDTPLFAAHPHTHVAPAGGGTTTPDVLP